MVATNDDSVAAYLRSYRNHGMTDRDHIEMWGINSRLQPVQAIVGMRVLDSIEKLIEARIRNARLLDEGLKDLHEFIRPPERPKGMREVYQLYIACAARRDELVKYLIAKEVEVKVRGPGSGRESAITALQAAGLTIKSIEDVTPLPHNGCRPKKRRRV